MSGLLLLVLVTNPFIINQVLHAYEMKGYSEKQIVRPYDICIVMGGSVRYFNGQTVRPVFGNGVDRLMQAVALYKAGKIKRILLSGGSGYVTLQHVKEADLLKPVLLNFGIPDSVIYIENQSRNTFENAYMSKQLIADMPQIKNILIITSAYHVVRTKACFEKLNLKADYFPVDALSGEISLTPDKILIPGADAVSNWVALLHEWLGLITYKMAGYC
ncbi:MAG TPA: YdcF family protein [Bacteroidia bacterium]|nr:YdcF family protein [Bacteroidia bacterium]